MSDPPGTLLVGLVEDDRGTRKSLCQLIDGTPGYRCVGDWMSIESALADRIPALDVLVVDVDLPGRSGAEAVPDLLHHFPGSAVIMHTVFDDERLFQAVCNGARGYLLKGTRPAHILDAIREVAEGGAPLSPSVARRLVDFLCRKDMAPEPSCSLTPREVEVLALLAEGHSYQTAADQLQISINTVRKHVRSIYDRLQVHTKSAAVSKAIRAGWI